jgi:putative transposase
MNFIRWYNTVHCHSALKFVTPTQRHQGLDVALLEARKALYTRAKAAKPERWRSTIRNWERPGTVWLNPVRETVNYVRMVA